jgi:hypothetical protein
MGKVNGTIVLTQPKIAVEKQNNAAGIRSVIQRVVFMAFDSL